MKRLLTVILLFLLAIPVGFAQKREPGKVKTVVIDPGHGGDKPGAIGHRCQEKNLVLSVAKKFGKLIEDNFPDVKVIYTRSGDQDITLANRAHIANQAKADLFISIHANSHPTSNPTGVETFVMGLSQSKANMEVAKKENSDILLEADYKSNSAYQGFDPNSPESYVMFAMYQNAYLEKSLNFAQFIQQQYQANIKTINRGVKQAELFVIYKTAMPSVLTEIGFISNPEEEAFLVSDEGQAQVVLSLFNAFATYKASEEGTSRISNPVIDLPGYSGNPISKKPSKPATPQAPPPSVAPAVPLAAVSPAAPVDSQPAPIASHVVDSVAIPVADPLSLSADSALSSPAQPAFSAPVEAPSHNQINERPQMPKDRPDVHFKVQFLSCDHLLKDGDKEFKGVTDYEFYLWNGSYRYTYGDVSSIAKAKALQEEIRKLGFKDSFVVAFFEGQRISLQQAREMLEE